MLVLYIVLVTAAIAAVLARKSSDKWLIVGIAAFFSFIISIFGVLMASDTRTADVTYRSDRSELVALKDGKSTTGAFFLGCGVLDQEMRYTWYQKDEDGSIHLKNLWTGNCVVYEDSNVPYVLYIQADDFKSPLLRHLLFKPSGNPEYIYAFHIPTNSIRQDILLDAQ